MSEECYKEVVLPLQFIYSNNCYFWLFSWVLLHPPLLKRWLILEKKKKKKLSLSFQVDFPTSSFEVRFSTPAPAEFSPQYEFSRLDQVSQRHLHDVLHKKSLFWWVGCLIILRQMLHPDLIICFTALCSRFFLELGRENNFPFSLSTQVLYIPCNTYIN